MTHLSTELDMECKAEEFLILHLELGLIHLEEELHHS